jgi:hypothetical protein
MTPKEKATELFQKYYNEYGYYGIPVDAVKNSKQNALIGIDEIIKEWDNEGGRKGKQAYWKLVKEELINL